MARELIYRVSIDTASAKRQAANIRATFESELRQIKTGELDTSSLKTAIDQAKQFTAELQRAASAGGGLGEVDTTGLTRGTSEAQRLRQELERASGGLGEVDTTGITRAVSEAQRLRQELERAGVAANNIKIPSGGGNASGGEKGGPLDNLIKGATVGAAIAGLRQLAGELDQVSRRGAVLTQLKDVLGDYAASVGTNANAMISAAKKASAGTIAEYELILNANRAIQFQVASTAEQYAQLIELSTALGRAQGISDTEALGFLTTGLARESRLILDNLGLIIDLDAATSAYAASMGKTSDELTSAERKQALLAEAYKQGAVAIQANRDAAESAATRYERFDANVQNLKDSFGELTASMLSVPVGAAGNAISEMQEKYFEGGPSAETLMRRIEEMRLARDKIMEEGEGSFLGISTGQIDLYNEKIAEAYQLLVALKVAQGGVDYTALTQEDFSQSAGSEKPLDVRSPDQKASDAAKEIDIRVAEFNDTIRELEDAAANLSSADFDGIEGIEEARNDVRELMLEFLSTGTVTEEFASKLEQITNAAGKTAAISGQFSAMQDALGSTFLRTNEDAAELIAQLNALNSGPLSASSPEYQQTLEGIAFGLAAVAESAQGEFNLALQSSGNTLAQLNQAILAGKPGLEGLRSELISTRDEIVQQGFATEEQAARIRSIGQAYTEAGTGIQNYAGIVGLVGESFFTTNQRAADIVGTLNELAVAYTNGEIGAAAYQASVQQLNIELEGLAVIDSSAATAAFGEIATAINSLNTADMEIFPDLAGVRDELAGLYEEIGYGTSVTSEQAAELNYLQSVAAAYADSTSGIVAVQNELGQEFLRTNGFAASLVEQMYMADGAYRAGQISSAQYAGILAALTGNLYTVATGAGVATNAILALAQAQAGFAAMPGYSVGYNQGSAGSANAQAQQADINREHNRKEADRVAKEEARQAKQIAQYNERAARSAAKQSESAAKKAGNELEKAAKKAGQELISALKGVEGLFDSSSVTEGDMALGSAYKDKADEYLRRLRDEVENGIDWPDVSIEEAAEAISSLGLEVAGSKEAILAQFEELHNSSALYANEENISKFINDEAVQYALKLQELAAKGEANIFAHFGVVQETAVEAAQGGGVSGGASLAPLQLDPIEPANFIDVDPIAEGLQTGLDNLSTRTGAELTQAFANIKGEFFTGSDWFGSAATGDKGKPKTGPFGPMTQQEFLIKADPNAAALVPYLTGATQGPAPAPLKPTLDTTSLQTELDALELKIELTPTLAEGTAQALALALGDQLAAQTADLSSKGRGIGDAIKSGIVASMDLLELGENDGVQIDIAALVGNNLQARGDRFIGQGKTIGTLLYQGITQAFANTDIAQPASEGVGAIGMSASITEVTLAETLVKPDISVLAVLSRFAIDDTALKAADLTIPVKIKLEEPKAEPGVDPANAPNAITPLITGINSQIRSSSEDIKREGATVAQIIIAGIVAHWQAGAGAEEGGAAGPIAAALMTNVSTQFTTSQNMFYALGFIPAGSVESGFKAYEYTDMDGGILSGITNGIRENIDNYMQRGATIGGYVQRGLNDSFSSEVGLSLAVAAGAAWGSAFQKGVLNQLSAGSGLVTAITDKVMEGIATEMEQP